MMTTATRRRRLLVCMAGTVVALCLVAGCKPASDQRIQGYVEGEFVYVASPLAGTLETLSVQRGAQVKAGDVLFRLDSTPEKAAQDEAERRLAQARANDAAPKRRALGASPAMGHNGLADAWQRAGLMAQQILDEKYAGEFIMPGWG
jgi:multidrug efflux pump subunit AcrA (membrane-fusion protein)